VARGAVRSDVWTDGDVGKVVLFFWFGGRRSRTASAPRLPCLARRRQRGGFAGVRGAHVIGRRAPRTDADGTVNSASLFSAECRRHRASYVLALVNYVASKVRRSSRLAACQVNHRRNRMLTLTVEVES
jgi:hypothetical protein